MKLHFFFSASSPLPEHSDGLLSLMGVIVPKQPHILRIYHREHRGHREKREESSDIYYGFTNPNLAGGQILNKGRPIISSGFNAPL